MNRFLIKLNKQKEGNEQMPTFSSAKHLKATVKEISL
jgi:hypothetical protein